MNLKRLEHLIALAEELHFGRAAERVHLSQPAFSRSIQALEHETNLRLVDRESGEVRLTLAGQFLLERAKSVLFSYRGLQHDIQLYSKVELGKLSFGVGPFPAAMLMHKVVPALRKEFPSLQLIIDVHNWQILMERLKLEQIEFFVADSQNFSEQDPEAQIEMLAEVSAGFFVHKSHPLAHKHIVMRDLLHYGIATTFLPADVRKKVAMAFGLVSEQQLILALECDDVDLLKTVAKQSDTILGMIHGAIRDDLKKGELVQLTIIDQPPLFSGLGLISLKRRSQSPAAIKVITEIKKAIALC